MAFVFEHLITPADLSLIRRARQRGGAKAAEKMIALLSARVSRTAHQREQIRQAMMESDADATWPPRFLQERK